MRKTIIVSCFVGGALGIYSALWGGAVMMGAFAMVSSIFLLTVAVGGIMNYYSEESCDIRDIYKEKDLMQKEKIQILNEKLIEKEKQLIIANAKNSEISINTSTW